MIDLTPAQRSALRAQAHHLNPVVRLGQHGLTEAVLKEIDLSLKAHELIKVKLQGAEREARDAALVEICNTLNCAPVQHIGNILVLWREKPAEAVEPAPKRRSAKPLTKKQAVAAADKPRRRAPR